jgi:hypothetical protein
VTSTEETIDIETAGNAVTLRLQGHDTISLVIRGDNSAGYEVDVKQRDGTWKQGVGASYTGSSDYDDVRNSGADKIRVRCSSGTNNANDTATITLMAN